MLLNWESPFRDPFHENIAEQSAFCGSLDIPEFLFEGSFFLFFLIPLLALIVLYVSMGLTISRCTITSTTKSNLDQVSESGRKEQLLQQTEERGAGNKSRLKLKERGGDEEN